jgi:predicted Zn-dependent peptidase
VQDEQIATHVSVDFAWRFDPGAFIVAAELKPGVRPAKAEAAIGDELAKVAARGVTASELQKAKNTLRAQFLGDLATHGGRAHVIGNYDVLLGDWRAALRTLEGYARVTNDDVKRVARATFKDENRAVATLVPSAPAPR